MRGPPQAKNEQLLELEHALMSAEDALEQRQATLVECQDMLAEMQSFSEAQRARADQEQAQAQVGLPSVAEAVPSRSGKRHSAVAHGSAVPGHAGRGAEPLTGAADTCGPEQAQARVNGMCFCQCGRACLSEE